MTAKWMDEWRIPAYAYSFRNLMKFNLEFTFSRMKLRRVWTQEWR